MASDRRERPWRKLRVVVEVTVPPTSRIIEKDLAYVVRESVSRNVGLPREDHPNAYVAATRIKTFGSFWPAFRRQEMIERRSK